jgi:hypothetical protein
MAWTLAQHSTICFITLPLEDANTDTFADALNIIVESKPFFAYTSTHSNATLSLTAIYRDDGAASETYELLLCVLDCYSNVAFLEAVG